jgi:hypothetical protein
MSCTWEVSEAVHKHFMFFWNCLYTGGSGDGGRKSNECCGGFWIASCVVGVPGVYSNQLFIILDASVFCLFTVTQHFSIRFPSCDKSFSTLSCSCVLGLKRR